MITYQVFCTLPTEIEIEWRDWMLDEHIKDVMNTEMFHDYSLNKVLKPLPDNAVQYCIQYYTDSPDKYEQYRADFAPVLQAANNAKFGTSVVVHRTVMQSIEE